MDADERTAAIQARMQPADRPEERLWVTGQWKSFEVKRVPTELLVLNVDNRRFAAERRLFESRLGRSLDPENTPRDQESLEAILLDDNLRVHNDAIVGRPSKDTKALEEDLVNREQERPLWIRPDGTVHNGNRRLAVVRRRHRAGHERYDWVDVVIIPEEEVDDLALFQMEQHEQLTEDYKVRYTDVNLLLAIRDAAEVHGIDWGDDDDIKRVAEQLRGVMRNNKNYAIKQLYAVKYMEDFLEDLGQADQYELMVNQIERFRDIGTAMRTVARTAPERELDMLEVCYAAVRGSIGYQDIRKIRTMFLEDRDRFDQLVVDVRDAEAGWEPSPEGDSIIEPEPEGDDDVEDFDDADEFDEDDDEDPDGPSGPNMPDYEPGPRVRAAVNRHIDAFRASRGVASATLLDEVLNRMGALSGEDRTPISADVALPDVRERLEAVTEWVDQHRDLLN